MALLTEDSGMLTTTSPGAGTSSSTDPVAKAASKKLETFETATVTTTVTAATTPATTSSLATNNIGSASQGAHKSRPALFGENGVDARLYESDYYGPVTTTNTSTINYNSQSSVCLPTIGNRSVYSTYYLLAHWN